MNSTEFRKQLIKIMPGYTWTVHRPSMYFKPQNPNSCLDATGIQSSGSNILSMLYVIRREKDNLIEYEVKIAGSSKTDGTLARALRGLQNHYEGMASTYYGHASALKFGRKEKEGP